MDPDSQYENYMSNKGPISAASEVLREGAAQVWGRGSSGTLRARVLSGSMIMLVSSGLVGAMNLVYNLAIAHGLGAASFGHASAVYTVLMLLSSVTLSFQLLCSKFVAKSDYLPVKVGIYRFLHRRAWMFGIGISLLLVLASPILSAYLNLPTRNYILMLAAGTIFFIPLGVRRGLMQGMYDVQHLSENFVLEVMVKLSGALLLIHAGFCVPGVIAAVVASIVFAYLVAKPGRELATDAQAGVPATLEEGVQAIVFFVGQVIINNLDIILVKHFFSATEAGVYATIALVGRVVYMLSWSVVSSMFPFSARVRSHERDSRAVLSTALLLVALSIPFFRVQTEVLKRQPEIRVPLVAPVGAMEKVRRVTEDEVISEFLKSEFYQPEFDRYREQFREIVTHPDLSSARENELRRALLYRRRGRLWRELPDDTEWWQVELRANDLPRIRVFPRNHWRKLANGNFYLTEMVEHIRARVGSHPSDAFVAKLRSLSDELASAPEHDSSVLLIGLDEESPLTIIEVNHRMAAASLVSPQEIHLRFQFLCGFSPRMTECCWYQTDLSTLWRYARNFVAYLFEDPDIVIEQASQTRLSSDTGAGVV